MPSALDFVTIHCDIYGKVEIYEPQLVSLINSPAVQRLKGVFQGGITSVIPGPFNRTVSRFHHSVGAMILVRKLGGSLVEQAAALLHDISHTALSHVSDFVFKEPGLPSYHERIKMQYVNTTNLVQIIKSSGWEVDEIFEEERYPILELGAPHLCADRLDYGLRDAFSMKYLSKDQVNQILESICLFNGQICLSNIESAKIFAYAYMKCDDLIYTSVENVGLYEIAARAIKVALDDGGLSESDLFMQDIKFWEKVKNHSRKDLVDLVSPRTQFEIDAVDPDFSVKVKVRTIDPDIVVDGACLPLSMLDQQYKSDLEAYRARKLNKVLHIKILR